MKKSDLSIVFYFVIIITLFLNCKSQYKTADNIYPIILETMQTILKKDGNDKWANWIKKDIEEWNNEKTTKHHLRGYGGIGSLNDILISNKIEDKLFDYIKSIAYALAKNNGVLNDEIKNNNFGMGKNITPIRGWECSNCNLKEISKSDFENYKYDFLIHQLIVQKIESNELKSILKIDQLEQGKYFKELFDKIDTAFNNSNVKIVEDSKQWPSSCPVDCKNDQIIAKYWELEELDDEFIVIPARAY